MCLFEFRTSVLRRKANEDSLTCLSLESNSAFVGGADEGGVSNDHDSCACGLVGWERPIFRSGTDSALRLEKPGLTRSKGEGLELMYCEERCVRRPDAVAIVDWPENDFEDLLWLRVLFLGR